MLKPTWSIRIVHCQRINVSFFKMLEALQSNSPKDVDENDFIDASRLVYDGVREIRRAVLMNRVSEPISNGKLLFIECNVVMSSNYTAVLLPIDLCKSLKL